VEVQAENREEGFQVLLVVLGDHRYLADNPENPVVVIHRQDFQADVNQVVQVDLVDFHQDKDLPVDILVDVLPFPFRVVNQQAGLVQEQAQVVTHPAVRVEDFHRHQVVDILVADLVRKDIRAEGQENQKDPVIPVGDREDFPADRLEVLEVTPGEHKSLEAQEVDILVEGQGLNIQRVVKDLIVVQVLKDLAGITGQVDQVGIPEDLKVLEVNKAQVEHLAAATLVLDQEATQVDQEHKNQAVIQVVPALKDRVDIQAVQASKEQEVSQEDQVLKDQVDIQAGQVHKDRVGIQAAQASKDQEVSRVDQVRKDQVDSQLHQAQ